MKKIIALLIFATIMVGMMPAFGAFAAEEEHSHEYVAAVTKAATCTEDGETAYTCECGASYTEPILATGHVDDDGNNRCDVCNVRINDNNIFTVIYNFVRDIIGFFSEIFERIFGMF